jgi:hypothetical protein
MFESNESSPRPAPEIIPDQSLWKKGPDGKFYATEEGLRRAEEELLRKITHNEILKINPINKEEIQPLKILSSNLLKELTEIPADQLSALADFLRSLPPPPTSSPQQK